MEKQKQEREKVYEGQKKFVAVYNAVANLAVFKEDDGKFYLSVIHHQDKDIDLGTAPTAPYPAYVPHKTIDDAVQAAKDFEKKYFK